MSLKDLQFDERNTASILLKGMVGDIETLITRPKISTDSTPIVIISHPHPLYGGTMTNKVVHILARSFSELNAMTVRYNFRGVGKSAGKYDDGLGEAKDLQLLADELKQWHPQAPIWLAGFSFGAYVTARAQAAIKPEKLLLVAPPISMYPFEQLAEIEVPWMVIQGGQDEVIDASAAKKWVSLRPNQPKFIWMEDSGHFFHGKLIEVKDIVLADWNKLNKK